MKLRKNPAFFAGVMLVLGLAALALRMALYRTCVDEKGLLIPGTSLELTVWAVTGAACIWAACSGGEPRQRLLRLEALGELLAAVGIALALPEGLRLAVTMLDKVRLGLSLAAAVGLAWGAAARLQSKKPHVLCYGAACLFFALNAVCRYRGWVSHPQFQDYLFPLLGALTMMVFAYLRCVPEKIRLRRLVGLIGGFLCLAALAKTDFLPMYFGCGLWMLTNTDAPGEPV